MTEQQIVRTILDYLTLRNYCSWRNNTGGMYSEYGGRKRFIRFGAVGSPDIFVVRGGRIYGLEVKSKDGKQSEAQREWQIKFEQAGGTYRVIRSLGEVVSLLP